MNKFLNTGSKIIGASIFILFGQAAWAASLTFDNVTDPAQVGISAGQFESGFSVNGTVIQTPGLGSGSTTVAESANACVVTYSGGWIDLGSSTPSSRTIYFVDPADNAIVTDIFVINVAAGATISGTWTSDACGALPAVPGGTPAGDIVAANNTTVGFSQPYLGARAYAEVNRQFDLALAVVDSPDPVLAGSGDGNLTHTFSLSRVSGVAMAPGVTVDIALGLPTGVAVLNWTETTGTFDGATWTVGDVAVDGPVGTLTINLTVDSTAVDCVDCVSATGTVNTTSGTDTDPSNNTDIVDPTSVETAASASSGFDTSIMFTNGNDGMVDVTLVCNGGLPLEQTTQISAASGVNFSVTNLDFIAPGTNCTISLSGLDNGYTAAVMANGEDTGEACVFSGTPVATESAAFATDRANTCVITAIPEPTMVMVDTDVVGVEDPIIDTGFVTTISCDNVSPDTGSMFGTAIVDDTTGAFTADWYAEPGETSDCTVTMVPNSSVVEGGSCTFSFVLGDEEAGCDVTGTVFFEGIPTLSQYGMAILALLMLSVGFVGFRRFN